MLYAFKSIYENQVYDEKKKKELIRKYIKDETIKRAGKYAKFETKQRKMACWLMQRGYWYLLLMTFKLKK